MLLSPTLKSSVTRVFSADQKAVWDPDYNFCLRDRLIKSAWQLDKRLRDGSDNEQKSLLLVVPFVAGVYSAIEYRLHVKMLPEEHSGKEKTD